MKSKRRKPTKRKRRDNAQKVFWDTVESIEKTIAEIKKITKRIRASYKKPNKK